LVVWFSWVGCMGNAPCCPTDGPEVPKWGEDVLCCGGDKSIYQGTLGEMNVAVCIAKDRFGSIRVQNEIDSLKKIGAHPYIITMYYNGKTKGGDPYLAQQMIEPIGFDLDRLKNQYQFAGQSVPVSLIGRIIGQLADALKHMHGMKLIHRDLKTENVLVDHAYETKLIDMGICAGFGAQDSLRAPYMAPELCCGQEQGAEVDCWGVGVILHQVYQNRWQLLDCQRQKPVQLMPGMPSTKRAMEPKVRETMEGLLAFSKEDRWTMDKLTECEWVKKPKMSEDGLSEEWKPPSGKIPGNVISNRQSLQFFQSLQPMPTALAVNITQKNHSHLISKPLGELELGKKFGVTVLLIRRSDGTFEKIPGAQTQIQRGDWIYFGVPQGEEEFNNAVDGLESLLQQSPPQRVSTGSTTPKFERQTSFRSLSKKDVIQAGKLVEFAVEFDCFTFPKHIGERVEVGLSGLNLRSRFGINLAGIERNGQQQDEALEWFPSGSATVRPGDFGLVLREPRADGSSQPTLTDEDLAPLMNADLFLKDVGKGAVAHG